jgi:hypothetical protein
LKKFKPEHEMIELSFNDFHAQNYEDKGFRLYIVKNGLSDILYIGISTMNVWKRWFGWGGHMTWDGNVIYGESPIGVKIENHLPDSLNWTIQLWTLDDCIKLCTKELVGISSEITIHEVEPIMIQKLSPALNRTYNLTNGKDTTPMSQKERELEERINAAYRDIFDKKS